MIVKLDAQFYSSNDFPIMLILSEQEKAAIAAMKSPDQVMITFYPKDKGYTTELVQAWMQDGITITNPTTSDQPEYIPPVAPQGV